MRKSKIVQLTEENKKLMEEMAVLKERMSLMESLLKILAESHSTTVHYYPQPQPIFVPQVYPQQPWYTEPMW